MAMLVRMIGKTKQDELGARDRDILLECPLDSSKRHCFFLRLLCCFACPLGYLSCWYLTQREPIGGLY